MQLEGSSEGIERFTDTGIEAGEAHMNCSLGVKTRRAHEGCLILEVNKAIPGEAKS